MRSNRTIKTISGVFLILAFALGNTPTRILHHLFANHHDIAQTQSTSEAQISNAGFNCHCDSTVFTNPFILVKSTPVAIPTVLMDQVFPEPDIRLSHFSIPGISLRGPPMA